MGNRIEQVDTYLADVPENQRDAVATIRDLIHEVDERIHESYQYNMPTFEFNGVVCSLAARKQYISLYCNVEVVEKYREDLGKLKVGKSCIRFRKLADLPLDTVRTIIRESVEHNAALES